MRKIETDRDIVVAPEKEESLGMVADLYRHVVAAHGDVALIVEHPSESGSGARSFPLPAEVLEPLTQLLKAMAEGRAVAVVPTEREFTTAEAADFLNVSRPFVVKEMEQGRLPHRKVGSHRRVSFDDLLAYATQMRASQGSALERMADNARELGLEY